KKTARAHELSPQLDGALRRRRAEEEPLRMTSTSALDPWPPSVGARRRLRILHVSQPTGGGCATAVRFLAEAGTRAGHTVTVACPRQPDLPAWITDAGAHWHPLPMVRQPTPGDIPAVLRMRRLFERADVVHPPSS